MEQHKTRKRTKRLVWAGVIIILLLPVFYFVHLEFGLGALIRPLPSDERMIDNFRAHREDFEKLVKTFRYDFSIPFDSPSQCLVPTPENEGIMKRAHVDQLCADHYYWIPPDPYTRDRNRQIPKTAYREFRGIRFFYVHGPVRRLDANFSTVIKYYYYTPIVPKVKKGPFFYTLKGHQYSTDELLQTPIHSFSLYKSLNSYPPDLLTGECVYRQIEPQWFIGLCN